MSLEGRNEGEVLLGLGLKFSAVSSNSAKADLYADEGASFLFKGGMVRVWRVRNAHGINEARGCSMSCGVELLDFLS